MSAPPKTVLQTTHEEEAQIRAAVREAHGLDQLGGRRKVAAPEDAEALAAFLADPAVSDPIYDLPRPFTVANVRAWIEARARRREAGEGLLILTVDPEGRIEGYSEVAVWPERASGELIGAMRADRQNSRTGGAGMAASFDWMFETLGLRLIGLTAALDNVRSQKLIDRAGFVRMGERDVVRPDGTTRPSVYWEMTREQWRARKAGG